MVTVMSQTSISQTWRGDIEVSGDGATGNDKTKALDAYLTEMEFETRTTDRDMLQVGENTEFRLPGAAATSLSNIRRTRRRRSTGEFSEDTDSIACRATCDLYIQDCLQ